MKVTDFGIILMAFVIVAQIISPFLVVRISIPTSSGGAALFNTLLTTTAASGGVNADGKSWHDTETWTINGQTTSEDGKSWHSVETWTVEVKTTAAESGSSDYLVAMKEEEKTDDLDDDNDKSNNGKAVAWRVMEGLKARMRRWRNKMKRFSRVSYFSRAHMPSKSS